MTMKVVITNAGNRAEDELVVRREGFNGNILETVLKRGESGVVPCHDGISASVDLEARLGVDEDFCREMRVIAVETEEKAL